MQCTNHPEKEAVGLCLNCSRKVCKDCAAEGDSAGTYYCFSCAAAKEAVAEHNAKAGASVGKESRRKISPVIFGAIFLAAIAIAALSFIDPVPEIPTFGGSRPETSAAVLDKAIRDYAKDNFGRFPVKLNDLLGTKYLPPEFKATHLARFVYETKPMSRDSYTLKIAGDTGTRVEFEGGRK